MREIETDVLIIGAGMGGLSTAAFLAKAGVRAEVIERHPTTSILPKARGQNPITMEALRLLGLEQEIHDALPPGKPAITSVESTGLTGTVIEDHTLDRPDFLRFSPCLSGHASQARVEESLARKVTELGVDIRFNHVCDSLSVNMDGRVAAIVDHKESGERTIFRAKYLVAADGIRGWIPGHLGVEKVGIGHLKSVTAYRFKADLREYAGDNAAIIHYVRNAELPEGTAVLVSTDWEGEWVVNIPTDPDRTDEEAVRIIHTVLGRDDIEVELLGHNSFEYGQWVASEFRVGPVVLVGDAAHVMPPTGGQGGNSAVQDGYYLGWRLAAIINGWGRDGLIDQYAAERYPYTEAVTRWQTANLAKRRGFSKLQGEVGQALDHATLLFGYRCPIGGAGDGKAHFEDPREPTGAPGTRVPHVDVETEFGPCSPRDLLNYEFMLLSVSNDIVERIKSVATQYQVPITTHVIASSKLLSASGEAAMLVRPDGVITWRGDNAEDAASALVSAVGFESEPESS